MSANNKVFLTLNSVISCEPGGFRYFCHDITTNGTIGLVSGVLRHDLGDPEIASAFFHRDHWDMTQLHLLLTDGSYYRSRYLEINLDELNLRELDNDAENLISEVLVGAQRRDEISPVKGVRGARQCDEVSPPVVFQAEPVRHVPGNGLKLISKDVAELHRSFSDGIGCIRMRDGRLMTLGENDRMNEIEAPTGSRWITGDYFVSPIEDGLPGEYNFEGAVIKTDNPDTVRVLWHRGVMAYLYRKDACYYWTIPIQNKKKRFVEILSSFADPEAEPVITDNHETRKLTSDVRVHAQGSLVVAHSSSHMVIFNPFGTHPLKIDLVGINEVTSICMMPEDDCRYSVSGSCYIVLDGDETIPEISHHVVCPGMPFVNIRIVVVNTRHFAPSYGLFPANCRKPIRGYYGLPQFPHDEEYRGWSQNHFDYQEGTSIMRKTFDDQPPVAIDLIDANEEVHFGILTTIVRSSPDGNQIFVLNRTGTRVPIAEFSEDDLPVETIRIERAERGGQTGALRDNLTRASARGSGRRTRRRTNRRHGKRFTRRFGRR